MVPDDLEYIPLPRPAATMAFDGERFVTGQGGAIAHEHYLRYLFARQFCTGKDVLDVASGEGYGSSLLAQSARYVHGLDVDQRAVDFAQSHYGASNIEFRRGDARRLPYDDSSFDVVISFETLEHIEEHDAFLKEIKRVLRPLGLFVLSSPDREVYLQSEKANPFHLKELSAVEFRSLISAHFANARFGAQRSITGALLLPESIEAVGPVESFAIQGGGYVKRSAGLAEASYLLAIASDERLPEIIWGILSESNYVLDLIAKHDAEVRRISRDMADVQAEAACLRKQLSELHDVKIPLALRDQRNTVLKDVLGILS
jgi:ubiquinone/menaquinone biosynthesis C-methylase UbiE